MGGLSSGRGGNKICLHRAPAGAYSITRGHNRAPGFHRIHAEMLTYRLEREDIIVILFKHIIKRLNLQPFTTFKILNENELKALKSPDFMESFGISFVLFNLGARTLMYGYGKEFQSDEKANNQEILDKGFDGQKLSTEEIEKMKKENKDSKVIFVVIDISFDGGLTCPPPISKKKVLKERS